MAHFKSKPAAAALTGAELLWLLQYPNGVGGTEADARVALDTLLARVFSHAGWNEAVDDRVAALLVAGANVTLTYNDASNTYTIAAAGGGSAAPTRSTKTADYTLLAADAGNIVQMDMIVANTVMVNAAFVSAAATESVTQIFQRGTGATTIAFGAGVTVLNSDSNTIRARYRSAYITKTGAAEVVLDGDLL